MSKQHDLSGLTVLLTRPSGRSDSLARAIRQRQGDVCELPLIEIEPEMDDDAREGIKSRILSLDQYDAAIFISSNAAQLGMEWIDQYWPQLPVGLEAYAVGPGTAKILRHFDWPVHVSDKGVTSEDLLALPGLKQAQGKRIALFRGVGGRELIAETLRKRGAQVDYLELYRRHTPDYSQDVVSELIQRRNINAVVVTSAQILDVLLHCSRQNADSLRVVPVLVPSERVRQRAMDYGLNVVINAGGADDETVLDALEKVVSMTR
ncbi:uroporphyrinogen III methyltransferase [Pseudohongiella nitratireducens]|uniref:Uroporphyrinogen-III synthase n=1 Tax=Pseudohongiella nitratireducens TaxID=1768907 RepID=A0A917LQ22_9GAMM|nr:uroporphyrinogen-III synthase [Pseudohongiella nitratireducens]GGG50334.1 uroporphyrinogen III methyltransferase [Pseudohongiella nitratireducens]|tara:strand:- start:8472 stop:9260 length:789 start_codon:yes stop_codon:yes gene_type:complete